VMNNFTLNQPISVPQGYSRALKWNLAKEICAEYGFPMSAEIKLNAQESLQMIKALNARPAEVSRYDRALINSNRGDYGWILHGGYN